jgi:ornithine cyclodeaminase/alanine dehydrogenase-like protein (mu-crystallin family)
MKVLIVGHNEVEQLLPMGECIKVMKDMFRALTRGEAVLPLRQAVWQPDRKGVFGVMPAYLGDPRAIGGKFVTFFPENPTPYESHQGAVLLFECGNGRLLAIVDATTVTAIRTAAASAVATDALAREDATKLGILGSGTQAFRHLESMQIVRRITEVRVWSRNPVRAQAFAKEASSTYRLTVESVDTAEAAVSGSDIICTTTAATQPILEGKWLSQGCHINAIGSSTPPFRELDSEAVARSKLYTDRAESLYNEADDYRIPRKEGAIGEGHLVGEIGELLLGRVAGRANPTEITLFKSLGLAVEDLAAAHHIYSKAQQIGLGNWVDFSGERVR